MKRIYIKTVLCIKNSYEIKNDRYVNIIVSIIFWNIKLSKTWCINVIALIIFQNTKLCKLYENLEYIIINII